MMQSFVSNLQRKYRTHPRVILRKKGPYILRMQDMADSRHLSMMVVDAYFSSSKDAMLVDLLEDIAIVMCRHAWNGQESCTRGLDLECDSDDNGTRTITQVQSGASWWGNSLQHMHLRQQFKAAKTILRHERAAAQAISMGGCYYGICATRDIDCHVQLVGADFWTMISGWDGAAHAVMQLLDRHTRSVLHDVQEQACYTVESFLCESGLATAEHDIRRERLFDFVLLLQQQLEKRKGATSDDR